MPTRIAKFVSPSLFLVIIYQATGLPCVKADRGIQATGVPSASTTTSRQDEPNSRNGTPAGPNTKVAIIAIVVSLSCLVGVIGGLAIVIVRRRRKVKALHAECGVKPTLPSLQGQLKVMVHLPIKRVDQVDSPVDDWGRLPDATQ